MKRLIALSGLLTVIIILPYVIGEDESLAYLKNLAKETALRYEVDVQLVFAVIQQESGWQLKAVSTADARGLMQIWPPTGESFCQLTKEELYDPVKNVDCGVRYLKKQLVDFHQPNDLLTTVKLALCAYNAGPGRAKKGLAHCRKIRETRRYMDNIIATWCENQRCYPRPTFPDSAKRIADDWYKSGGYNTWWKLVCEAIDVVYDRKMEKIDPQAVGKSASTDAQKKIWQEILTQTVADIHEDEKRTKKQPRSPQTIKKNIIQSCPAQPRETRRRTTRKAPKFSFAVESAKTIADNWFINGEYTPSQWWQLVCEAIDEIYDNKMGTKGKPAITLSQRRFWLDILNMTVDDIFKDIKRLQRQQEWPTVRIKDRIISACPEKTPKQPTPPATFNQQSQNYWSLSPKMIANKKFTQGNYPSETWWRFVCQAIDEVYYREIAKIEPSVVGKPATTPLQQRLWQSIFATTVEDIYSDEVRQKGTRALSKNIIENKITQSCHK